LLTTHQHSRQAERQPAHPEHLSGAGTGLRGNCQEILDTSNHCSSQVDRLVEHYNLNVIISSAAVADLWPILADLVAADEKYPCGLGRTTEAGFFDDMRPKPGPASQDAIL